ncbi:MAG: hypothetical protein EA398_13645 [Deltaproteobacteria bacterium]|nr:MAG: hypothetical protein EA398_13645 [Deltaproteobacteria bacterium]
MRLLGLQYNAPSAAERRLALRVDGVTGAFKVPEAALPLVGPALWSLLYPAEADLITLLTLADADAGARWRMEARVGARDIRVERGLEPSSVELAVLDPEARRWDVVVRGATDVQARVHSLANMPPSAAFAGIHCALPPVRHVDEPGGGESVEIVSTQEFMGGQAAMGGGPASPEERRRLVGVWRDAARGDVLERYLDHVRGELERAVEKASAMLDDSGELAELTRQLARYGDVRALSPEEEERLRDGPGRLETMERRLAQLEREEAASERGNEAEDRPSAPSAAPMYRDPFVLVSAAPVLVLLLASLLVDRSLALLNLLAIPVAAFAALRNLQFAEAGIGAQRGQEARARRLAQLREDVRTLRTSLAELQSELGLDDWATWKEGMERHQALRAQVEAIQARSSRAAQSPEYRTIEKTRERLASRERLLRRKIAEVPPPAGTTIWELQAQLRKEGIRPEMLVFPPRFCADTPLDEVQRHLRVAPDFTREAWLPLLDRLLSRLLGFKPEAARLDGDTLVVGDWRSDRGGEPDFEAALSEALRLSLVAAHAASGVQDAGTWFVSADRAGLLDGPHRIELRRAHEALGERLQIIALSAG